MSQWSFFRSTFLSVITWLPRRRPLKKETVYPFSNTFYFVQLYLMTTYCLWKDYNCWCSCRFCVTIITLYKGRPWHDFPEHMTKSFCMALDSWVQGSLLLIEGAWKHRKNFIVTWNQNPKLRNVLCQSAWSFGCCSERRDGTITTRENVIHRTLAVALVKKARYC